MDQARKPLEDQWETRAEASARIRTPVATLAQWAYQGKGPVYYRVGRKTLYRVSDLDRWLDEQRVAPRKASETPLP